MEESVCRVTLGNITKEYKKGTTYSEIAREFQPDYEHQIVLAMVDGYHLRELRKTVEKDCEIHFLTTADPIGNDTYRRSLCFLFIKAFHDISGHDLKHRVRIRVHFTMGPGFYCTVDKKEKPDETFLAKVEARMRELAKWQSQSKSVALILEKLWSCSISMECMTRKGFLRTGGFQR